MGRSRFVGVLAVMALGAGLVQGFGPAPSAASPIPARTSTDIAPSSADADSSGSWTPENAPMPGVLPNGQAAVHMSLAGTSCSSASFCVAVGYVSDEEYHGFPLAETFTDGTWTPTVLPQPPDASTQADEGPELLSVSCPQDGSCAAVGAYAGYDAATNSNYADPLLEVLTGGVWTATEGELPNGPNSGLVHLYSVSCDAAGSCTAVGNDADFSGSWFGLIYTLSFGTWQLQVAPVPADYSEGHPGRGVVPQQ